MPNDTKQTLKMQGNYALQYHDSQLLRDLLSLKIRFKLAVPIQFESDGPIRKFLNRLCLPNAHRSEMTQTINGSKWYSIQTR